MSRERAAAPLRGKRAVEVIAHRGFSAQAPENTLTAFRAAVEAGADRVEFDVLLTRDGQPVVIHDATLDRTTSGSGPVAGRTLEELRSLDAGAWFSPRFAGERVPTLEEALLLCRGRIALNVEIKGEAVEPGQEPPPGGVEARVVEALRASGLAAEAVVSSFEPLVLERVRRLAPEIPLASLYNPDHHRGLGPAEVCRVVGSRAFHCSREEVTPRWVAEAHRSGLEIKVYTVDDPGEMEELARQGVDGLFTNRPDLARAVLGSQAARLGKA